MKKRRKTLSRVQVAPSIISMSVCPTARLVSPSPTLAPPSTSGLTRKGHRAFGPGKIKRNITFFRKGQAETGRGRDGRGGAEGGYKNVHSRRTR